VVSVVWRRRSGACPSRAAGASHQLEGLRGPDLALFAEQPDWTLEELVAALRKRRLSGSRSALWRFLERHGISFKKACGQPSKAGRTWPALDGAGSGNRAYFDGSSSLVFIDETSVNTDHGSSLWSMPAGRAIDRTGAHFGTWETLTFVAGLRCDEIDGTLW